MNTVKDLLKLAHDRIASEEAIEKQAFTPMGAGGAAPPPMDPSMGGGGMPPGGPPMDPSMGGMPPGGMPPGGAPPMDPSMGGGGPPGAPPMDPSMDPSMGGGAPPGTPVMVTMEDLVQLFQMVAQGGMGGPGGEAPPPASDSAPNEGAKPEGGKGKAQEGKLDEISGKLDQMISLFSGGVMGAETPPEGGGMDLGLGGMPPEAMGAPGGVPSGMPGPAVDTGGGALPPGMPPGGGGGMAVQASDQSTPQPKHAAVQAQHSTAASLLATPAVTPPAPQTKIAGAGQSRSKSFRLARIVKNLRHRGQQ